MLLSRSSCMYLLICPGCFVKRFHFLYLYFYTKSYSSLIQSLKVQFLSTEPLWMEFLQHCFLPILYKIPTLLVGFRAASVLSIFNWIFFLSGKCISCSFDTTIHYYSASYSFIFIILSISKVVQRLGYPVLSNFLITV